MRSDLAKLTTEKERGASYLDSNKKYGGRVRIVHDPEHDYENEFGGFRSSARHRVYGWKCKEFSDVLTPLRGALRKNVGRPWDAVYSEFCQFLDRRSVSGIHIFGHLCGRGGEVTVKGLYEEDGKVYEHKPPGWRYWTRRGQGEVTGFYVHPRTGLLCYKPFNYGNHTWQTRAKLKALRDNEVKIDSREFRVINGCWFEVELKTIKEPHFHARWHQNESASDNLLRGYELYQGQWGKWHFRDKVVVDRKRSLSSKEIKMVKKNQAQQIKELEDELPGGDR